MGQTYAGLGARDPRLTPNSDTMDFRLTSLYRSWTNVEDPPSRVKPLPGTLLTQTVHLARLENTPASLAAAATLTLGFFFLLRPGEYIGTPDHALDTLFRLRDLTLWVGSRSLSHFDCPVADLHAATFATLTFTRQKNGVRNETIGHGRSGHPHLCPVLCLVQQVLALRAMSADPATPPSTPTASWRVPLGGSSNHATSLGASAPPWPCIPTLATLPRMYPRAPHALAGPWRCSAQASTATAFA